MVLEKFFTKYDRFKRTRGFQDGGSIIASGVTGFTEN